MEDLDESGRMESERIRRMRGRLSTFLTRGLDDTGGGATKLGL